MKCKDGYRPFEIETRLVCPCCHMGFISIDDEVENKFTFPSGARSFIIPKVNCPSCNECNTRFEIMIDKTLKIKMRKIEY